VSEEDLIREQIAFYRARASGYDKTSTPPGDPLAPYGNQVLDALDRFRPTGRVLEIASGTGSWTPFFLRHATSVTALDSSPEMLRLSGQKISDDRRIRYVEADVFTWEPDATYDVVFFANWLSHVPPARFEGFWRTVHAALAPGGRVFFADEATDAWRHEAVEGDDPPVVRRSLPDGRTYRVVKVFWDLTELQAKLRSLGWNLELGTAGPFFWGVAQWVGDGFERPTHAM
jgi:SAM-dependent methyltransferase